MGGFGRVELDMQPPPRGEFWDILVLEKLSSRSENKICKELHYFA